MRVMTWWHWALIGLALLAGEIATPGGFFIIFFGVGARVVARLSGLGQTEALWLELLIFAICSVLSLLLFRNRLLERFPPPTGQPDADDMIGKEAKAAEVIPPGGTGKVDMRGTSWNAQNAGTAPLQPGQACIVEKRDGLTFTVRAK